MKQTNWTSTSDLLSQAHHLASELDPTIDAILGVARSGLLPAVAIATRLHLPLYTLHLPDTIHYCGSGSRLSCDNSRLLHLAIIDDTNASGRTLRTATQAARKTWPRTRLTTAVIYCDPNAIRHVDHYAQTLHPPHFCEWNFANAPHLANAAWDLDGVICHDFAGPDNDGLDYLHFLASAKPLHLPRRAPVPLIITARCGRYRTQTEAWLATHGVRYQQLEMGHWSDAEARRIDDTIAPWKAHHYSHSSSPIMVESDPHLAAEIARLTGKPTLCPQAGTLFPCKPPSDHRQS